MRYFPNNSGRGFTLIELMIVLAVVAVLASLVGMSVSSAVSASSSASAKAELVASLTRARSFAASGTVDVVLCPSLDNATCATGYHWENGWIAFAAVDPGSIPTSNDTVLIRHDALRKGVHLITSKGRTRIRFQPSGGNAGSNVTFTFCDSRGPKAASAYAISNAGNLHPTEPKPAYVELACAGL